MTQVPAGVEVRQHQVDTRGSPSDNHVMKREESMEPHCWQGSSRKTTLFRASAHAGERVGSAAELESEAEASTVQYISAERPSIQLTGEHERCRCQSEAKASSENLHVDLAMAQGFCAIAEECLRRAGKVEEATFEEKTASTTTTSQLKHRLR